MAPSPPVHDQSGAIRQATRDGTAEGLRQHLPIVVGIGLRGCLCCALASFAHFVLGVGPEYALVAAASGGTGLGILSLVGPLRRNVDDVSEVRRRGHQRWLHRGGSVPGPTPTDS